MAYHSGMQPTNRKDTSFSFGRQLPVRPTLYACGFTLYLGCIVAQPEENVKSKKKKAIDDRLFSY